MKKNEQINTTKHPYIVSVNYIKVKYDLSYTPRIKSFFMESFFTIFCNFCRGFVTSFLITSLSFSFVGMGYMKLRSVVDEIKNNNYTHDLVKETKLFFQVCYEIATKLQTITNDISNRIGAWLLVTDSDFQDNFNKILYEEKYNETFDKFMSDRAPSMSKDHNITTKSILIENTPIGNVVMYYDITDKCLFYYANRSLTTRQLQSVGRKFVIQFCCPQIIDEMRLEKEEKPKTSIKEDAHTETKEDKHKYGFASKSGVMTKFKTKSKEDKSKTNKDDTKTPSTPNPVSHVENLKFLRKGSLADFSFTQKIKTNRYRNRVTNEDNSLPDKIDETSNKTVTLSQHMPVPDKSRLSFSEYKRLMKMKQENDNQEMEISQ